MLKHSTLIGYKKSQDFDYPITELISAQHSYTTPKFVYDIGSWSTAPILILSEYLFNIV